MNSSKSSILKPEEKTNVIFVMHLYYNLICSFTEQIHAMSTGRKMREISQDVLDRTSRQYEETDYWEPYDRAHFMAVVRDLERECPEFAK